MIPLISMEQFYAAMLAVSNLPAASIVVKATFVAALALTCARLSRRSRAAVRHALLSAAFGTLLVLPIASLVAPPVGIAVPATTTKTIMSRVSATPIGGAANRAPAHAAIPDKAEDFQSPRFSLSTLLLTGWLAGMAFCLTPMAIGLWQVRKLRRSGLPWRHGQSVVDELAREAGIRRRVQVMLHEGLPGPMTCGVLQPAIVLPLDVQEWASDELNRAIVHELEHVRRGDWVTHCFARAVCAVYWFHPLVWIASRQLSLEAERSCDDAVLGRSEATAYADQLVGLAQRLAAGTSGKSPLLAMASRADLATRVGAVLDSRQRRGRAGALPVAVACIGAVALVLAISPLRMVAAPQAAGAAAAPSGMPTFTSNTMLVIEDVLVSDQTGKRLDGLKADDFTVTEDGKPQMIAVFEFQSLSVDDPRMNYYILAYYSTNGKMDDVYRSVKIALKNDATAKLDYRAGYYAGKFLLNSISLGGAGTGPGDVANGPGVTPPRVVTMVDPAYSEEARKAKYSGSVTLNLEVGVDGKATDIRVLKRLGLGLDEKAIDAIQRWRFIPGNKDGQPAAVRVQVVMNFRLL